MIPQGIPNPEREQFTVDLKCHRCGQTGISIWEENAQAHRDGPDMSLISVSSGFYERLARKNPCAIVLVCHSCKAVQLG